MTHEPAAPPADMKPGPWEIVEGKCNARKTGGSGLCRHRAGRGTDHVGFGQCSKHGGATINGRKHGLRLRTDQRIGELLDARSTRPMTALATRRPIATGAAR